MVMILRIPAPRWHGDGDPEKEAHCYSFPVRRDYDPWFGIQDDKFSVDTQNEAMDICNGVSSGVVCPQRHECLIFALKNNNGDGIWGGMHEEDRTFMRRFQAEEEWAWHEPTMRERERLLAEGDGSSPAA